MDDNVTQLDERRNGAVTTPPVDKPVLRASQSETRRMYTYAERKLELEQQIVSAQLLLTEAAMELKDVNARYAALQQQVAARFAIVGPFQVTRDGVIIVPEPA